MHSKREPACWGRKARYCRRSALLELATGSAHDSDQCPARCTRTRSHSRETLSPSTRQAAPPRSKTHCGESKSSAGRLVLRNQLRGVAEQERPLIQRESFVEAQIAEPRHEQAERVAAEPRRLLGVGSSGWFGAAALTRVGWCHGWCARTQESRQRPGRIGRGNTNGSGLDSGEHAVRPQAGHSQLARQLLAAAR